MLTAPNVRVIFLLALVALFARCNRRDANVDLRVTLGSHGVEEVDVLRIPETVFTHVVTADQLEAHPHAKLTLGGGALLDHLDDLDQALALTECRRTGGPANDLRTGIIFYAPSHKKIRAFYYGLNGKGGQIDGTSCDLTSGLYKWARKVMRD